MTRPSGILLAGGASRRFGRPKIVEPIEGAPLFHRPLRALVDSCADVVIVLAPDGSEPPLPEWADGVSFARDRKAYEGPLAGARTGLEGVRGDHALLIAADMPGISAKLLALMAAHAGPSGRAALVLADSEGWRPLPAMVAVVPARATAGALLDRGERRLRALIEGLEVEALPEAVWSTVDRNGAWRQDVNVPGDLQQGSR